jgi:hypothetical protein
MRDRGECDDDRRSYCSPCPVISADQGEKPVQIAALQAYFCTGARRKKKSPGR